MMIDPEHMRAIDAAAKGSDSNVPFAVRTVAAMVKAQAEEGRPVGNNSAAFLAMYLLGDLDEATE